MSNASLPCYPRNHYSHVGPKPEKQTPVSRKHRLLGGVCQCCVRGFSGRTRVAFLRPRKPAHAYMRTHHSPTGNRPSMGGLASIICVRVPYQLKSTAPLKCNTTITHRKNIFSRIPIAVLQCASLGVFACLIPARTAFAMSGRVWFANHIKHRTARERASRPRVGVRQTARASDRLGVGFCFQNKHQTSSSANLAEKSSKY